MLPVTMITVGRPIRRAAAPALTLSRAPGHEDPEQKYKTTEAHLELFNGATRTNWDLLTSREDVIVNNQRAQLGGKKT